MGVPGSSMALAVARRMGLDEDVLKAAEAEVARQDEPTRKVIEGMEKSRRRIERERQKVEMARRRARGEVRELEGMKDEVRAERDALRREMERALDESMRAAKSRLEPLIERLRNVPKSHREAVDQLGGEVEKLMVSTPLGERREQFARSLKKGDEVFVPKFREKATVRKIDKGGRKLGLLLNGLPVEIGFDDVSWLDGPDRGRDNGG
jgi:DNA mismatch repair protein MutS2